MAGNAVSCECTDRGALRGGPGGAETDRAEIAALRRRLGLALLIDIHTHFMPERMTPGEPVDPMLVAALMRRVSEAESRFDGLALLAAGTSDAAARSTMDNVAAALGAALNVPCAVGYASTSLPSAGDTVLLVRRLGARRVVAASYFLAPGRLHDAAEASARSAGAVGVAAPLGAVAEFVDLVLARAAALA